MTFVAGTGIEFDLGVVGGRCCSDGEMGAAEDGSCRACAGSGKRALQILLELHDCGVVCTAAGRLDALVCPPAPRIGECGA